MDGGAPMRADYDVNSLHQRAGNMRNIESIVEALLQHKHQPVIRVGDFGCATGLNSMMAFSSALKQFREQSTAQVKITHVDLPTNEWGVLFNNYLKAEESYRKVDNVFTAAIGGSMYTRLFPDDELTLVYSSFTLHWMSIILDMPAELSENEMRQLARKQSHEDLTLFLDNRLRELTPGGRIIIRTSAGNVFGGPIVYMTEKLKEAGKLPRNAAIGNYSVVYHRSLEDYLTTLAHFQGRLNILATKVERNVHPVFDLYAGDPEAIAEKLQQAVTSAGSNTFRTLFKKVGADPEELMPICSQLIKEYYLLHPEPVMVDEVHLVLEKVVSS